MRTLRFATAAELLLKAEGRKPSPTDDAVDVAWLGLMGDRPAVAESKLRTVVASLEPRLFLQADLRLVVATGLLTPRRAARLIAETLDPATRTSSSVGVVRGESLLDRLEELSLAGCELRETPGGSRLVDEPSPPVAVWAPAGAGPIAETLAVGARVVVTQSADIATAAIAASVDAYAWPPNELDRYAAAAAASQLSQQTLNREFVIDEAGEAMLTGEPSTSSAKLMLPDLEARAEVVLSSGGFRIAVQEATPPSAGREVIALLPEGPTAAFTVSAPDGASLDRLASRLKRVVGEAGAEVQADLRVLHRSAESPLLAASFSSASAAALERVLGLTELACDAARGMVLSRPLADEIFTPTRTWRTEAHRELLQYGVDVRPADEWLSG